MQFSKEVCYFSWASCIRRWIKAGSQAIRKHKQDIHPQHCNSGEIFLGSSRLLPKVHSGFFQNCRTIKSVIREEPTVSMDGGVHPSFPGIESSSVKRTHSSISRFYGSFSAIHRRFEHRSMGYSGLTTRQEGKGCLLFKIIVLQRKNAWLWYGA